MQEIVVMCYIIHLCEIGDATSISPLVCHLPVMILRHLGASICHLTPFIRSFTALFFLSLPILCVSNTYLSKIKTILQESC